MNKLALLMAAIMATITIVATTAAHADEADLRGPFEHFEESLTGPFEHTDAEAEASVPRSYGARDSMGPEWWRRVIASAQREGGKAWAFWKAQAATFGRICGEGHPGNREACEVMETSYAQDNEELHAEFLRAKEGQP